MIYLVGLLVAAGGALIGWPLGLAVFMAAFEILRLPGLEAGLDSPVALSAFRYAHSAVLVATGLWLVHRWRPRAAEAVASWKVVAVATVAGMGCALLATPLIFVTIGRTAQSFAPLLVALVAAMIAGAAVAAVAYRRPVSLMMTVFRGALASAMAVALVWFGFIFDSDASSFAAGLGRPRTILIDIRIPYEAGQRPELATVRVAMRSQGRDLPGQPQFWLPEHGVDLLRVSLPLPMGTRDRTVVLTRPNEPDRLLRIELPPNPRRTREDFGPWLRFDPPGDPPHEARYLTW